MLIETKEYYKIKPLKFHPLINITVYPQNFTIPDEIGVYIFLNSQKICMYVGCTGSLRTRYCSHTGGDRSSKVYMAKASSIDNIVFYTYVTCKTIRDALMYEKLYTYLLKPVLNYGSFAMDNLNIFQDDGYIRIKKPNFDDGYIRIKKPNFIDKININENSTVVDYSSGPFSSPRKNTVLRDFHIPNKIGVHIFYNINGEVSLVKNLTIYLEVLLK